MKKPLNLILALGAVAVAPVLITGCGGIPGNAVAKVGDTPIETTTFNHWVGIIAKSSGQGTTIPDPPNYAKCIATQRKLIGKPAKGAPKVTDQQLKQQCQQTYQTLRDQAMQLLVQTQWLEGAAKEMKVNVTDSQVKASYETQKKQAFPKDADFKKFLQSSGYTIPDLMLRVRLSLLQEGIRNKVISGKDKVSDADITKYYNANKARFAKPEQRDLLIVLTKDKKNADAALAAIKGGQSFAAVAKKYSVDQASKQQGGKLLGVAKGQQEKAFDTAIFAAKKGVLSGPVKTQFGYYVFEVTKVTAASQQSLASVKPMIKQQLISEGQQNALQSFVTNWTKEWQGKTDCQKDYTVTGLCKNAPAAAGSTGTPPPGSAPPNSSAPPSAGTSSAPPGTNAGQ